MLLFFQSASSPPPKTGFPDLIRANIASTFSQRPRPGPPPPFFPAAVQTPKEILFGVAAYPGGDKPRFLPPSPLTTAKKKTSLLFSPIPRTAFLFSRSLQVYKGRFIGARAFFFFHTPGLFFSDFPFPFFPPAPYEPEGARLKTLPLDASGPFSAARSAKKNPTASSPLSCGTASRSSFFSTVKRSDDRGIPHLHSFPF